jgi:hypothetical protein
LISFNRPRPRRHTRPSVVICGRLTVSGRPSVIPTPKPELI